MFNYKFLIINLFLLCNLFASNNKIVLVSKMNIEYKESITKRNTLLKQIQSSKLRCTPFYYKNMKNTHFVASHYISSGKVICKKDLKILKSSNIKFNFGNIEIEQSGKIIYETDNYIKFKKSNGKIEKIYKNGNN